MNNAITQGLLGILPIYERILGDVTDEQVAAIASVLPGYCTQLQIGLKKDFTLHGIEQPHDYTKAFERIFLLRATASFRMHNILVQTPQMEAALHLWRSFTIKLTITDLLDMTAATQDTHIINICSAVQAIHNFDKSIDHICKPTLPHLRQNITSLIGVLRAFMPLTQSEEVAEEIERLLGKLQFNGLD